MNRIKVSYKLDAEKERELAREERRFADVSVETVIDGGNACDVRFDSKAQTLELLGPGINRTVRCVKAFWIEVWEEPQTPGELVAAQMQNSASRSR